MSSSSDVALIQGLRESARPLSDGDPHDALIEAIGGARLVLLGEASHGSTISNQPQLRRPFGTNSRSSTSNRPWTKSARTPAGIAPSRINPVSARRMPVRMDWP